MKKTITLAPGNQTVQGPGNNEQSRREFIKKIIGGSLLMITVPSLASTTKRYLRGLETEQVKTEYIAKYSPKDFNPFAHRWAYGIDAYKCIGCNQCMIACKLENGLPGHPSFNNR